MLSEDRSRVQKRRLAVKAVLAGAVAAFFAVVALAQDARQPGLRLLWAGIALVWLLVAIRLLRPTPAPAAADEDGPAGGSASL